MTDYNNFINLYTSFGIVFTERRKGGEIEVYISTPCIFNDSANQHLVLGQSGTIAYFRESDGKFIRQHFGD